MASHIQEAFHRTSGTIGSIFSSTENLQYFDKIVVWGSKFFEGISKQSLPQGLSKLTGFIGTTEMVINGVGFFTFSKYFFYAKKASDVGYKLGEKEGKIYRSVQDQIKRDEKVGKTEFLYQLKHKTHLALANIGYAFCLLTCTVSLFEALKIPVMGAISQAFGAIPTIGHALSQGFMSHFYVVGGYALVAAHSAMVFDSVKYLFLARTDSSKDVTKGALQLVSRIGLLAIDLLLVSGVKDPIAMGVTGLSAGIMGVAYAIYKFNRQLNKEAKQEALLKKATEQAPAAQQEAQLRKAHLQVKGG